MDVIQQHEQALTARALTGLGRAPAVVRVSLGIENTEADVDALLTVMDGIARHPQAGASEKTVRRRMGEICTAAAQRVYGQR